MSKRLSTDGYGHRRVAGFVIALATALAFLLAGCGSESNASEDLPTTWSVEGPLRAWEGALWIVDATPIQVPSELGMDERRWLGAVVTASGSFDETGQRIAERVSVIEGVLPNSTLPAATVSGPIEEIDDARWVIAGGDVFVPAGTHLDGSVDLDNAQALVEQGSMATVEGYQLADGRVLAVSIVTRQATPAKEDAATEAADESSSTPVPPNTSPDDNADTTETSDNATPVENSNDDDGNDDDSDEGKNKENNEKPEKPDDDDGKHKDEDKDKDKDEQGRTLLREHDRMVAG